MNDLPYAYYTDQQGSRKSLIFTFKSHTVRFCAIAKMTAQNRTVCCFSEAKCLILQ